ncbi:hypothetical protein AB1Y20_004758 [Prymnesium parvum]|uniref:Uncharacterized protein n=1 Tax=Prymnesium parvum TaxID=97485 RepID=A0AB34IZR2_PRYPA
MSDTISPALAARMSFFEKEHSPRPAEGRAFARGAGGRKPVSASWRTPRFVEKEYTTLSLRPKSLPGTKRSSEAEATEGSLGAQLEWLKQEMAMISPRGGSVEDDEPLAATEGGQSCPSCAAAGGDGKPLCAASGREGCPSCAAAGGDSKPPSAAGAEGCPACGAEGGNGKPLSAAAAGSGCPSCGAAGDGSRKPVSAAAGGEVCPSCGAAGDGSRKPVSAAAGGEVCPSCGAAGGDDKPLSAAAGGEGCTSCGAAGEDGKPLSASAGGRSCGAAGGGDGESLAAAAEGEGCRSCGTAGARRSRASQGEVSLPEAEFFPAPPAALDDLASDARSRRSCKSAPQTRRSDKGVRSTRSEGSGAKGKARQRKARRPPSPLAPASLPLPAPPEAPAAAPPPPSCGGAPAAAPRLRPAEVSVLPKLTLDAEVSAQEQPSAYPQLQITFTLELPTLDSVLRRVLPQAPRKEGAAAEGAGGLGSVRQLLESAAAWEARGDGEREGTDAARLRLARRRETLLHAGLQANREGRTSQACRLLHEAALIRPTPSLVLSVANMRLKLGQPEVALLMYDFVSKAPSANLKELSMASNKQAIALSQLQQRSQRVGLEEHSME